MDTILNVKPGALVFVALFLCGWAWMIYRNGLTGFLWGVAILLLIGALQGGAWLAFWLWGEGGAIAFVVIFFALGYGLTHWHRHRRKGTSNEA